jgi:DNA gyrase/topoisomerase IV subunit A
MRELVLSWIDERRAYKRRLLNKKITKLMARVSLLEILLRLLDKDNIEKTMTIIKNSNHNEIVDRLKEHGNMSSFQATKIADMKLSAFTKDATEKYNSELIKIKEDLEITMSLIKSEKKIDKIILSELDDLKKYASPRKSRIVEPETGAQISNTEHSLIITSQGLVKKLFYEESRYNDTDVGLFKNLDYPTHRILINNLDSIMLFDSFGKYSCVPVHIIDSSEISSHGKPIYDYSKLNGKIVSAFQYINKDTEEYIENKLNETINLITLSKCGFIKKTKVEEFGGTKTRNSTAMKIQENDELVFANAIMDSANVLIYTKKGKYIFMYANTIPLIGKNVMGVLCMNLDVDDECVGLSVIGENDEFIVVVTEKGNIKKCESRYLMADMKKRNSTYVATLDVGDSIIYVGGAKEKDKLFVCSRASYQNIPVEEIPLLPRKAKCQKIISVPQGNNIISALIN